jgi:ABC-type Zn uptake system ZnuABC Zn-binding protein ZnuA
MRRRDLLLAGPACVLAAEAARAEARLVVLAGLLPLYAITFALAYGTAIDVRPVPAVLPGLAQLPRALARQNAATSALLQQADAVITVASLWPDDPLFRQARARNIRVVQIDAARSLAQGSASVMVAAQPASNAPWRPAGRAVGSAVHAWFSPANAMRMAEIIGADLQRLAPDDASRIAANQSRFSREMQALQAEFDARFQAIEHPVVFALTDRFIYLTNAFGIDVDGYFLEDDVKWTEADFAGLADHLATQGIRVVVHHWQPDAPVAAAIARGGARLLVLDDGESGAAAQPDPRSYQAVLRADLEALYQALSAP